MYDKEEFKKRFRVDNWVRIQKEEFENFDPSKEYIGHFNLAETNSKVGERYIVMMIAEGGETPLLAVERAFIVECVDVQNHMPYSALDEKYFEHSVRGVSDLASLKAVIKERYTKSRPGVTSEEIERMGVAYTLFKVVQRPEELGEA